MKGRVRYLNSRLQDFTSTIFSEMSALAVATGSINLGQGFPDTDGPDAIKRAAIRAIESGHNQYPPVDGISELRSAIAWHQKHYNGLDFSPETKSWSPPARPKPLRRVSCHRARPATRS